MRNELTKIQKWLLGMTIPPIVAIGAMGGVGTYTNLSTVYGSGTAVGALAAGEGATVVMALILIVTTAFGQSSPRAVRAGLWLLPLTASVIGLTVADSLRETVVFAATPMAITAAAEGLAFLTRRTVIYQDGRDAEAEARATAVIRDLAYHRARAAAHPSRLARFVSERASWRLARRVGGGDVRLGADLIDVQRARLTQGADHALAGMFTPDAAPALPAAPELTESGTPELTDSVTPELPESRSRQEAAARPHLTPVQVTAPAAEGTAPADTTIARPAAEAPVVVTQAPASLAAGLRELAAAGITDPKVAAARLSALMGREVPVDSVKREARRQSAAARAATAAEAARRGENGGYA